ncbi:2-hydroxy-3-oxopropionate reductase [Caulifigura coniformis]|uniref:2-hydroxy-3-oxopropionate reductase n=1 Tax=Caulifigura coniformis TaxID=2527983 RepID=A0A517SMX4_9PLAN|nr:NAD(P)-dependent oxidoreductase [Caulifigura coniformis]QDT57474.1 2-hydroxy-3-oxopropionate reductase [Caulifigura coniformis]
MTEGPVGVVGLGLTGTAISERLLQRGYAVRVWNRTPSKAEPLIERGAEWSDDPGASCERVVISLFSSDAVAEIVARMNATLRPGQYLIDTTTGVPEHSVSMGQRLAARGVNYLDAPISGSSEQIRQGEAVVMVGGEKAAFEACADLWPVLGKRVFHTGRCGSAAKMKLVTNLVLGLNRAALAEGLAFAELIGVDPAEALNVLKDSPASSRTMDTKGHKMITGDYSVQAKLSQHLKDVCMMLEAAKSAGRPLPLTDTHRQLLERAVAAGLGEMDNSSIVEVLRGTTAE